MEGHDVDARDAGYLVDRDVVVGDVVVCIAQGEVVSVTYLLGDVPKHVGNGLGILHGVAFAGEGAATTAHHVEQYAETGLIAVGLSLF